MFGIDLNKSIEYEVASLRFFNKNEHHITRFQKSDILLMVYDGILRFSENGIPYEIKPGEYFIQKGYSIQKGEVPSDEPKYLYVQFFGSWSEKDGENILKRKGNFDYESYKNIIEKLDKDANTQTPYIQKMASFLTILSRLYQAEKKNSKKQLIADKIADFISNEYAKNITLDLLCKKFHFTKNHIINIFKKEYSKTPITYLNEERMKNAEYLIELTSEPLENIALNCGYQNYSYFYKQFLKKHGISPSQWRTKNQI